MAYIEENMKLRRTQDESTNDDKKDPSKPTDPQDDFHRLMEQYKNQSGKKLEEGNVTNSLAMLTAIPEVDLGMECVSIWLKYETYGCSNEGVISR